MNKHPIAVLLADIHFSVQNLYIASKSYERAAKLANELHVPLIIAGDLMDGKAIIRGEVANRLLELVKTHDNTIIIPGNHDLINEKGCGTALNFLRPYATICPLLTASYNNGLYLIPYCSDTDTAVAILNTIPTGSTVIMHQGLKSAKSGHYINDRSALELDDVKGLRILSGHYHKAQDIVTEGGIFSYIGNPYTLSFGEADDPPKGFGVLYSDGTLDRVDNCFRKHTKIETTVDNIDKIERLCTNDILWLVIRGEQSLLDKVNKNKLGSRIIGHSDYKLELIPNKEHKNNEKSIIKLTLEELFDKIISDSSETDSRKAYLKTLWRQLYESSGKN